MSMSWNLTLASVPGSPCSDDEPIWLLDSDYALHTGKDLLASLPLSAVLPDRSAYADSPNYLSVEDGFMSPTSSFYGESLGPGSPADTKPSRAELASKLLNELDQLKEEPFSDWLEEKIELPIFEDFAPPVPVQELQAAYQYAPRSVAVPAPVQPMLDNTEALLMEFESVYGALDVTHLTPPQSPPTIYTQSLDARPATQLLLQLQAPYAQPVTYIPPQVQQPHQLQYQTNVWTPADVTESIPAPVAIISPDEIEQELAVFDELVRSHTSEKNSADEPAYVEPTYIEPPSPSSTSNSSYASSEADDEWPTTNDRRKSAIRGASKSGGRSKPYARNVEDKRSRKKEQNKNAATRYRLKKKAESEVILNEERGLRDRHSQLDTKCTDLQREIKYLKGLMRDLFKAKGLIK